MADDSRTIRVTGLPVDMVENRLIDKIQVHFLRKKNGGGEIQSVTVSKSTPGTAFITFEKSEVAVRLAKREHQEFKVNDKSYEINISLLREQVDPDTVLLKMSVVVDHSKLPEGKETLLSLHQSYPGVRLTFNHEKDLYILKGHYSEVQSLISLLLGSPETKKRTSGDRPPPRSESKEKNNLPLTSPTSRNQPNIGAEEIEHTSLSGVQGLQHENENWNSGLAQLSSFSHHASHEPLMEDRRDFQPEPLTSFEDFSLVVDSDIFHYLQKYCVKEYESILKQNEVEVLDVNCGDITTLYLRPRKAQYDRGMTSVIKAHQDLSHLYQEKESQLRKEQLSKHEIPTQDVKHVLESVRMRLPMLMIDEDKDNVYIVGSKSDVSEAKQFIVDVRGVRIDKHIQSGHLFGPSQPPFQFSKQTSPALSEQSDVFQPVGNQRQRSDDIFTPFKGFQTASREEIPNYSSNDESKSIFSVRMHGGFSEERRTLSDVKRTESGGSFDREKYTEKYMGPGQFTSNHDENKPTTKPPYSVESQSFSLGHMALSGDPSINSVSVSSKELENKAVKKSGLSSEDKQTSNSAQDIFPVRRCDSTSEIESGGSTDVGKYTDSPFISHKNLDKKESSMQDFIPEERPMESGGSFDRKEYTDSISASSKELENKAVKKSGLSSEDKQTSNSAQDIFPVRRRDVTSETEFGGSTDVGKNTDSLFVSHKDLDKKESSMQDFISEERRMKCGSSFDRKEYTDSVFVSSKDLENKVVKKSGLISEDKQTSNSAQDIFSVRRHDVTSEVKQSKKIESGGSSDVGKNTDSLFVSHKVLDKKESSMQDFISEERRMKCGSSFDREKYTDSISVSSKDLENKALEKSSLSSENKQTSSSDQDFLFVRRRDVTSEIESGGSTDVGKYTDSVFVSHKILDKKESSMQDFIPGERRMESGGSFDWERYTDFISASSKDLENKALEKSSLSSEDKQTSNSAQDVFSVKRRDVASEILSGGSTDVGKYTDSLFISHENLDKKESSMQDFIPGEAQAKRSERPKSTRGNKTKPADSGRERKMAANLGDTRLGQDDNLAVGTADNVQPHSLAVNKPSPITCVETKSSANKVPKGVLTGLGQHTANHDEKKPQSFSLGHIVLSGDPSIKSNPNVPALRRSNSFSGKIKSRQADQTMPAAINLSPGQEGLNLETFQTRTRSVFTLDVVLSCQLWVYIKWIYITEVESLTSDLQVKEIIEKGDFILRLSGADSEKVNKCHHGLKSLISRVKMDFDERTIPLSILGVLDCKDKILVDFCTVMKQKHDKVKIVVMSKNVLLLGPKPLCENVEATMMEVFQTGVKSAKTTTETKSQKPSESESSTTHPTTTKTLPDETMIHQDPYMSKMSDRTSACISKRVPQSLKDQTRDVLEEGNQDVNQNPKEPSLKEGEIIKQDSVRTLPPSETLKSSINDKADDQTHGKDTLQNTQAEGYAYTDQEDQPKNIPGPRGTLETHQTDEHLPLKQEMEQTSHIIGQNEVSESEPRFQISSGGNQDLLCSVCKADHSTVKQKSCGYKFCSQCEKESHTSCKICSQASNQDTVGIKGSVFIRESTVTIPGFIRDTTLRLIYDIPDGIQGDDHPCPGAPFKGGKFQAFLPYNEDTKRLLPLLEKAFFKGHTFTVQVKRSRCKGKNESREGKVVWGSIPHKTSTDGGMSKNGYPDSSFIKRLTKALKAAGIEE